MLNYATIKLRTSNTGHGSMRVMADCGTKLSEMRAFLFTKIQKSSTLFKNLCIKNSAYIFVHNLGCGH